LPHGGIGDNRFGEVKFRADIADRNLAGDAGAALDQFGLIAVVLDH
jgi:hypothetical protein